MPKALAHPYLFLSRDELPALRKKLQGPVCRAHWKKFLRNADTFNKEDVYGRENARWALGACAVSAFAYALSGKEKYGLRAKREAEACLSATSWHTDRGWNRGAELPTSELGMACALVYDLCHDLYDEKEKKSFRKRLLKLSTQPYLDSNEKYLDWWTDNPVTNWSGVCHGGNGLAALAMYFEEPLARKASGYAWKGVTRFLKHVLLADGGGHEGVMYRLYGERFSHICYAAAMRTLGRDAKLYADATQKHAGYWMCYLKAHDDRYANFNNMGEETFAGSINGSGRRNDEAGPMASLCALYERHVPGGDTLLRWGADHGGAAFYYRGVDPYWLLWRSDRPVQEKKPALQPAVLFRGAGHAVLQSKKLWVAFNGGWTSNSSHNNRDLGTFVLTWDGTRLIHDPGYGRGETGQHSTINVGGQVNGRGGKCQRFGSGKGFDYYAVDLSAAYPGSAKKVVRHAVMVGGRYLVLLDEVRIQGPGRIDIDVRFQTRGKVKLDNKSPRAEITHRGARLQLISAAPADAVWSTKEMRFKGTIDTHCAQVAGDVRRRHEVFVTVVWPDTGKASKVNADFVVAGKTGTLTVKRPGGKDTLVFTQKTGGWLLQRVNGASAAKIGDGSKRSVVRLT